MAKKRNLLTDKNYTPRKQSNFVVNVPDYLHKLIHFIARDRNQSMRQVLRTAIFETAIRWGYVPSIFDGPSESIYRWADVKQAMIK